MKRYILFSFLAITIAACSKDNIGTTPSVSIRSFNGTFIDASGVLVADLNFTDKEGDLDSVIVIRRRTNAKGPAYTKIPFGVPKFTGRNKGTLSVYLDYATVLTLALPEIGIPGSGGRFQPDTLQLKFQLKDKAGNYSDSTDAKQVIVIR